MTTIFYFRRQNYGNTQFYFAKKAHRAAFRQLTGKKTMYPEELKSQFNAFGNFSFTEVLESSPEVEPISARFE